MIVILTGAKKNVGDFLIGDRAKKLLREFVDADIVELDRFQNLENHLEIINKSKALILCGGPAYAKDIYKGIYPLVDDLEKIKVPIIPFGLGWSGQPFGNPEAFKFQEDSLTFLKKVHQTILFSSCRDVLTQNILSRTGFKNVIMTGCPVWYDLEFIGKPFLKASSIKKIVFTTAASSKFIFQTLKLLKEIRKRFPMAQIYFSYHRGILPSFSTGLKRGFAYSLLALMAKAYNVKVLDVSDDLSKIDFYKDCDLHIGYRVHAHLYFLSKRIPSMLINEDGRGLGMVQSMNLPIFNADDDFLVEKFEKQLDNYLNTNFSDFTSISTFIDKSFLEMKRFLKTIDPQIK